MTVYYGFRHSRCHYCDKLVYPRGSDQARRNQFCMATRDHYIPKLARPIGLKSDGPNTVTCCLECNGIKGHTPPEVFEFYLRNSSKRGHFQDRKADFEQFVYQLVIVGFRASKLYALMDRPKVQRRDQRGRFLPVERVAA